jgi:hypothetical protein
MRKEVMASKSNIVIGALAAAAVMIGVLPAAQGIDAQRKEFPNVQVNRAAKGDRMAEPNTVPVKNAPVQTTREIAPSPESKPRILDGCDPMFSPVTVPTMAHIAGRCVG